jgi:HSP20 family protein
MDIKTLNPWNWFRHEDASNVPAVRNDPSPTAADPFVQMHQEMDRAFANLMRSFGLPGPSLLSQNLSGDGFGTLLRPHVDVISGDREYKITVEVPGVDEKDVKLELLADGALVISGEKRREHQDKDGQLHRVERAYGAFRRVLSLPDDVDRDKVDAQFKNGVLTITCPRNAAVNAPAKQIEIRKAA